jgi:WXG100 protein secretion system (Wss), protein YukD
MSTFTPPRTIQITLRRPRGSIRLATPTDVPLGDLMPDFLDVVEQPDSDSWAISPRGANPYPSERTLAELGVTDGAALVLYRRSASPPSSSRPDRPPRAERSVAVEPPNDPDPPDRRADARCAPGPALPLAAPGSADSERPLSERTARTLPDKLSLPARYLLAMRALASGTPRSEPREPAASRTPAHPRSPAPRASPRWRGCAKRGAAPSTSTVWTNWSWGCLCSGARRSPSSPPRAGFSAPEDRCRVDPPWLCVGAALHRPAAARYQRHALTQYEMNEGSGSTGL